MRMNKEYLLKKSNERTQKYRRKNDIKEILSELDMICLQCIDENCREDGFELVEKVLKALKDHHHDVDM
jgi:hypothetical protein